MWLLTQRQWREGDVAALQAVAAQLGLEVPPLEGLDPAAGLVAEAADRHLVTQAQRHLGDGA